MIIFSKAWFGASTNVWSGVVRGVLCYIIGGDLFTYLAAGQVVGGLAGRAVQVALPGGQHVSTLHTHVYIDQGSPDWMRRRKKHYLSISPAGQFKKKLF